MNVFNVFLIRAERRVVHEKWFLLNSTYLFQTFTEEWRLLLLL